MVPVLDIVALCLMVGTATVAIVQRVVASRKKVMPHVFAQGILHVTGEGEVVIDEVLPADKSLLKDPEAYITVQFDPNQPAPPPCPGGLPDEVDWELFFTHVHDVGLHRGKKREQLKLKVLWRVQSDRAVLWTIMTP